MTSTLEDIRRNVSAETDPLLKARLGQFLTAAPVAGFMAKLFSHTNCPECLLLDPGAGIGSLSAAFLDRWERGDFRFQHVMVDAFEIDHRLQSVLDTTLLAYARRLNLQPRIHAADFIEAAVCSLSGDLYSERLPQFTHTILNPPYKKIPSHSAHRTALRRVGIETVNLYSAFVALSLALLGKSGQLVAIIPRSFCNGPYYKSFRNFVLSRSAILHLHLFATRNKAFKDDSVLQENIIIMLERAREQGDVVVTTSRDESFSDLASHSYPFSQIVHKDDPERFIRIPHAPNASEDRLPRKVDRALVDLGIEVSTGPVVDFRMRNQLRQEPDVDTAPLLYPGHFVRGKATWPKKSFRKPNAIAKNTETERWLFPNGFYTVVRRFSSKEEKRRVVASVVEPHAFPGADALGFENHLNVFHQNKHGLPKDLAYGLALFLNTSAVDCHFRTFNGHTQINATDLRRIKYPPYKALLRLGKWARRQAHLEQTTIDEKVRALLS